MTITCAEFPGLKSAGALFVDPKIGFTVTLSWFGLIPWAWLTMKFLTVDDAFAVVSGVMLSFP